MLIVTEIRKGGNFIFSYKIDQISLHCFSSAQLYDLVLFHNINGNGADLMEWIFHSKIIQNLTEIYWSTKPATKLPKPTP